MEVLQEEIYDQTSDSARESFRNQQYQRGSMQRSAIVDRLRREGCRITKQRKIILDIILQEDRNGNDIQNDQSSGGNRCIKKKKCLPALR